MLTSGQTGELPITQNDSMAEELTIVDADTMTGDVLLHFSNGTSVLFRAHFLWGVRDHDGNVPISYSVVTKDELVDPDIDG